MLSFDRFRQFVLGTEGEVKFSLTFSLDDQGRALIIGKASTAVNLQCQACLEEFLVEVSCEINMVVLDALEDLFDMNEDRGALVATGKTISVQDILEDELIVALPMVPRHVNACPQGDQTSYGDLSGKYMETAGHEEIYRPFSDLALKYKGSDRKEV